MVHEGLVAGSVCHPGREAMTMTTRNAPSMEYDTTSSAVIELEIVSLSPKGHMLILLLLSVDVNCIPK